jgi:thioredoxin-dependent peroxiredoxin
MGVKVGDRVDDIEAPSSDGQTVTLSELAGDGPLVVFFYPKAFTGGCTAEACHFRDLASEFAELGATRVGVSRDSVRTQARFADEHGFDYPLLADPDGVVATAFGAKRRGPLPSKRQTFVLDHDLTVLGEFSSELNMEAHADEALALLRSRTAG